MLVLQNGISYIEIIKNHQKIIDDKISEHKNFVYLHPSENLSVDKTTELLRLQNEQITRLVTLIECILKFK